MIKRKPSIELKTHLNFEDSVNAKKNIHKIGNENQSLNPSKGFTKLVQGPDFRF